MDACIKCNNKATWLCDCSFLLCSQHMEPHLDEAPRHKISKFKPYEVSEAQRNDVGKILIQLQMLDLCSHQLIYDSNIFIQEVSKLVKESLQRIQEKRAELLIFLQIMNSGILAEGIRQFSVVSETDFARKTSINMRIQDIPQEYIKNTFFKVEKKTEEAPQRELNIPQKAIKALGKQAKRIVVPRRSFTMNNIRNGPPQKKKVSSGCTPQ